MNIALWILQAIVALGFVMAGSMKALTPKDKLGEKMGWVADFSGAQVKLIGVAEVLGGIGVVAPAAFRILPWLTPTAATALVLLMLGAIFTHIRRKEAKTMGASVVLALLSCCVALGRFFILPF